jgi:hypothetical protein
MLLTEIKINREEKEKRPKNGGVVQTQLQVERLTG